MNKFGIKIQAKATAKNSVTKIPRNHKNIKLKQETENWTVKLKCTRYKWFGNLWSCLHPLETELDLITFNNRV